MTEFFNELIIFFFDWFELIFILVIGFLLLQFLGTTSSTSVAKKSPREFLGYTAREIKEENVLKHTGNKAALEKLKKLKPAISLSEGVKKVEEYAKHCGYDQSESTKISIHFRNCFEKVKAYYEQEKIKREGKRSSTLTRMIIEKCDILNFDCREQLLRFLHYMRTKKSFIDIINIPYDDIDRFVKMRREYDN